MTEIILILGGARSGKSRFAVDFVRKGRDRAVYIATAPACDSEMRLRIQKHKKSRPKNWLTIETGTDIIGALKKIPASRGAIIIECIGTYVSNLMRDGFGGAKITANIKQILKQARALNRKFIIVSNEVGGGLVPETASGRLFRDITGNINQIIARCADQVYLVTAGIPARLK